MNIITTTLSTTATFSDDGLKRYLLKKTWDTSLPTLAIIMLAPSIASGVTMDSTTNLVLNNASELGFGSVSIVNLFATLGDFTLTDAEHEDPENMKTILDAVKEADEIIYAPGVGKNKLQVFQERSTQVLTALRPYEKKLKCLTSASGKAKLLHPLCPSVRKWHIAELRLDELLSVTEPVKPQSPSKKRSGPKVIKKEVSA